MTTHTEREIMSQPEVWQQTLDALDPLSFGGLFDDAVDVIVTGCGSTHYLAMTAAALLRDCGLRAWALPASELLEQASPRVVDPRRTVLLAISRSGTTTETIRAVDHFRSLGGGTVATISCYPDSALAVKSDVVWAAPAAAEQSVAQTRSFTSMALLVSAMAGALQGADLGVLESLPGDAATILTGAHEAMHALATNRAISTYFFLGSGALFGIASEGMLKLKEMSLTASEAYHALEFRHGPMSLCDRSAAVLALISPERASLELAVLRDIRPMGAVVTEVGNALDVDVSHRPPWARPALYLLPLQLLALERARHKRLDPDKPRHLTAVIHLDESADAS